MAKDKCTFVRGDAKGTYHFVNNRRLGKVVRQKARKNWMGWAVFEIGKNPKMGFKTLKSAKRFVCK